MYPTPRAMAEAKLSSHPVLRTGVSAGASLCVLSLAWLLIANRVSFLDRFALVRNLAAAAIACIFLLLPVCRFLRSPLRLFVSGLIAWTMLTLAYGAMETGFPALESRMGAFHLFVLGGIAYGLVATVAWVAGLVVNSCRQPIAATRRRTPLG